MKNFMKLMSKQCTATNVPHSKAVFLQNASMEMNIPLLSNDIRR